MSNSKYEANEEDAECRIELLGARCCTCIGFHALNATLPSVLHVKFESVNKGGGKLTARVHVLVAEELTMSVEYEDKCMRRNTARQ